MTEVLLKDEPTRQAVCGVLWRLMGVTVGDADKFYDLTWDAGDLRFGDECRRKAREEVEVRLDRLCNVRTEIEFVESAALGQSIALDAAPEALRDPLRSLRNSMQENPELLFGTSSEKRLQLLAVYDAAGALLDELLEPIPA